MEVQRGQVVRSLAGHDKGGFLAVVQVAPPLRLCVRRETPPPGAAQAEKTVPLGPHGHGAARGSPENQSTNTVRPAPVRGQRGERVSGGFSYVKTGRN